jgi:hypothetical protein
MFKQGEQVLLKFSDKSVTKFGTAVFVKDVPGGLRTFAGTEDTCVVRVNQTEIVVLKTSVVPIFH